MPVSAAAVRGGRDPVIDLLRVTCVVIVVLGHWLSSTIWWWDGRVGANSILVELPWLAPASWIFVTVPVLFFVGGFANVTIYRSELGDGRGDASFVLLRARRLLGPVAVFGSVWLVVQLVLRAVGVGGDGIVVGVSPRGLMPFGPLWFVGVYLLIVALVPLTVRLHDRFAWRVVVGLVLAAAVIDAVRFGLDWESIGWVNLVIAWLIPHQLGYFHGRGVAEATTVTSFGMGIVGFVMLVVLTASSTYPTSVGGLPHELSNMRPPTMVIVALSLWQVGWMFAARPALARFVARPAVQRLVDRLNPHTMSIYLWHMTAMLVVVLLVAPMGLSRDHQPVSDFVQQRPLVVGLSTVVLAVITAIARVRPALLRAAPAPRSTSSA